MEQTELLTFHDIGSTTVWIVMLIYFAIVMLFGSYFGRYTRSTSDFFFGGRRFSWWLITMSIVATGVGSHSFVKYSAKGFEHGLSSTMTYINDWFFVPFFLFGWLPIVVYSKVRSIPEYFEKRFSPSSRFIATILLLFYMIGYIGIGFLTLGKAMIPLLPESFSFFGTHVPIELYGVISVIAIITGIYITFGGQTAVIFTDLLQGFILLFAGLMLFAFGIGYLGGFQAFWDLLPVSWRMPLADFNNPPDFNFAGIFWQDGIAGSIGFLFMNQGLLMRFMACKSVNEGRKAAAINILFILPISAIVVGNAGWIGKAISVISPDTVSPAASPDQIFVVVANIILKNPVIFGFVMAALTAALMSTVDTLINATSAIFVNDVYRPIKGFLSKKVTSKKATERRELGVARIASVGITVLGVLAVIPFDSFPTVYEAHGYFHSTLTPPLVVAIFFGVFWKKFTPAGVITTFLGGVALMLLGAKYPGVLIAPFDHGIFLNPDHPYTYIRALYNILVCAGVAVLTTWTAGLQHKFVKWVRRLPNTNMIMAMLTSILSIIYTVVIVSFFIEFGTMNLILALIIISIMILPLVVNYYVVGYDAETHTSGLVASSIQDARRFFKGSEPNDTEGEKVLVHYKVIDGEVDEIRFSEDDMQIMAANPGDLVYISDKRKWLGGLKSIHSVYGEPHNENGIAYINDEQRKVGIFAEGKILEAEKEL
ncbi:MAG: sodium:solute symporter family protein [Candidatus Neomarinimicrobiota bacterium]